MSGLTHSASVKDTVSLDRLKAGEGGQIFAYQGNSDLQLRLKEMGLVRGTRVTVIRFAPLGDPMELLVRGYHLSIRKKDAAQVLIVRIK
jgi:Fe2+ transport system protein FeoA